MPIGSWQMRLASFSRTIFHEQSSAVLWVLMLRQRNWNLHPDSPRLPLENNLRHPVDLIDDPIPLRSEVLRMPCGNRSRMTWLRTRRRSAWGKPRCAGITKRSQCLTRSRLLTGSWPVPLAREVSMIWLEPWIKKEALLNPMQFGWGKRRGLVLSGVNYSSSLRHWRRSHSGWGPTRFSFRG